MSSCKLPDYHKIALDLLEKGVDRKTVLTTVGSLAKIHNNSEVVDRVNTALADLGVEKQVTVLTKDDKTELATLWDRLKNNITEENLKSSDDVVGVIQTILGEADSTRFIELLEKQGTKLERRIENRRAHIEYLEKIRRIHVTLGNTDIVAQLDADIETENARLEQKAQNSEALEDKTDGLVFRQVLLENFRFIALTIDKSIMSDTEMNWSSEVEEIRNEVRRLQGAIGAYETKLKQLQVAVRLGPKDKRKKAKERLDKFLETEKPKYKENKKKLQASIKKGRRLQVQELVKGIKDLTGKSIADRAKETETLISRLDIEIDKTQATLMKMGLSSIASDARDIYLSSQQMMANQSRLITIAAEGFNIKIDSFEKEMASLGEDRIGVVEAQEAFGEFAVNVVLRDREPVKLPDGSTTQDMSGLTIQELRKAGQIWKSQLISTYDGGFFSEDPSLMTEETFNVIDAIARGRDIVDGTTPEAVDPQFPQSLSTTERAANTNLGTIPEKNKFKTHRDAATALESSLRRLRTIFGYRYFNGFISEKMIRQILHPKLMDIHPKAWEAAQVKSKRPRLLSSVSEEERLSLMKGTLIAHGANLNDMPEFNDSSWPTDNSKLISFDIETFGDVKRADNRIDGVYCIQIHRRDTSDPTRSFSQTEIWVNNNGTLVDAKKVDAIDRQPLTKEQITFILQNLENSQNNGFKVITHNGNDYDFGQLKNQVTDINLLTRVGLRSFDTLANITSQVPETTWNAKQRQRGKKLKEVVKENFTKEKPITVGYGGRIQFTDSYPVDLTTGEQIRLDPDLGITQLWTEASNQDISVRDWYKFDAYAENDAELTINLFLHMSDPVVTQLKLRGETETEARVIPIRPAVSNLWLNNNSGSINNATPQDSLGSLGRLTPQLETDIESTYFKEEIGYDANIVYDLLTSWWLGTLLGDPKSNETKINQLLNAIRNQINEDSVYDAQLSLVAQENQQAVKPVLEDLFGKYGYVLTLSYSLRDLNDQTSPTPVVTINDNLDGSMPTGEFNEEALYKNKAPSPEAYEQAVIASFLQFTRKPEVRGRFQKAILERVNPRAKKATETVEEYWTDVINTFLKEYLPSYTGLRQFGNAELDWKPAVEVGMAIAQVMMDQKPGVTAVDALVQVGTSVQMIQVQDEQALLKGRRGRSKEYVMPARDKVHMAQPHALSKEELAFEGWRLKERVRHILRMDINDTNREELLKWIQEPRRQNPEDPISFFVKEHVLRIVPDAAVRSPFASVPNYVEKQQLVHEHLFQIPRLLMSFNHDCTYMGMNTPPRFFKGEYPVFYLSDFASAGGPTAAALMGGALDQLAHMTSYGLLDEAGKKELLNVLNRGYDILGKHGEAAFNPSNKSDYKYNGKHNLLAMMIAFRENNFKIYNDLMQTLQIEDETGKPATPGSKKMVVAGRDLGDPRFIFLDLLIGATSGDYKGVGYLNQIANNPSKFNLTEAEGALAVSIAAKLQIKTDADREKVKNLLKGAITPAFYQAGYPGILQGLTDKNNEGALGDNPLTDDELELLATIATRSQIMALGTIADKAISILNVKVNTKRTRLIDKSIGIYKDDLEALNNLLLQRTQTLDEATFKTSLTGIVAADKAKNQKARLVSMESWLQEAADATSKAILRAKGTLEPTTGQLNKETEKLKDELLAKWKARLDDASAYWADKGTETMPPDELNTFIYEMNKRLAGGTEAAKTHLLLFALNNRATTPYVLQDDVVDLHQFIMGVHIDREDYVDYLNKEIYFRYGVETASGRNHMVAWYGLGPESSKYAQPRVMEKDADYNPYGMWNIQEIPNDPAKFEDLFMRQVLLDLAKHYRPPDPTGTLNESRESYFKTLFDRSKKELVATEVSKYLEQVGKTRRKFTIGGVEIDIAERNKRNRKASGTAYERARMRTLLPDSNDIEAKINLDPSVDGFGALRGAYADIDFTQRGIYALANVQHRLRIKRNKLNKLLQSAKERLSTDPNGFVPSSLRGYESGYLKEHMPQIPMSADDIVGSIVLGDKSRQEQIAIKLQNILTQFALRNGLEFLLEKKDWARLYYIMDLDRRALQPAIKSLRNTKTESDSVLAPYAYEENLREARIRFTDGFIKTLGISSITLSGLKRFSTIDLMATLEERQFTLEDIQEIKTRYGEAPGWLQVLSYLSVTDKIERLMPLKFGLSLSPGIIVRGLQGRKNIPETSNLPIVQFGREVLQLYHIISSSNIAKTIATAMIAGTKYETDPNIKRDANGFVILESLDPRTDRTLYTNIWKKVIERKQELSVEMLENYSFVIDPSNRLRVHFNGNVPLREDQSSVPLTTQGPTDPRPQTKTQVDNPGTLWLHTPEMLIDLLNNLENYDLFREIELSLQTNKEIYGFKTRLDQILQEENAQLFEKMRENEEDINDALIFLHTIEPDERTKLKLLSDYRSVNLSGVPRQVIDVGSYLRVETQVDEETQERGIKNGILLQVQVETEPGNIQTRDIVIPTADAPYFMRILGAINLANKLGFTQQAIQLGSLLHTLANYPAPNKKVKTTNFAVKALVLTHEVMGDPNAEDNALRFIGINQITRDVRRMQTTIREASELINFIMSTEPHEVQREYYVASAMMEKMTTVPDTLHSDATFINAVASASGKEVTDTTRKSVARALNDLKNSPIEPEIADPDFNLSVSPTVFTKPDDFITSFANPAHRVIATKLVDHLQDLVARGIISQRVMDMKMMLIAGLAQHNPEYITELGFEENMGTNGESLMSASKRNKKYILGLNITAMKVAKEDELIFRFAEELVHIARVKFIKADSAEWQRVTGLFTTARSEGMIRELLITMNQGKPYAELEAQVSYAMGHPDEFFAHLGAFFLLREVFGTKEALHSLENRFEAISAGVSTWRKAFFRVKGFAKRMLTVFSKLRTDPAYSSLFLDAENVVMSIIGKGMAGRNDVENPDAFFNAYKTAAVTLDGKLPTTADLVVINVLQKNKTTQEKIIEVEMQRPPALRNLAAIQAAQNEIRRLVAEIRSKDAVTFMGKTASEVNTDIERITNFALPDPTKPDEITRLTTRTLNELGAQRSFLTHLVMRGMERRGTRSDYGWSLGGLVRKLTPDNILSRWGQNFALNSFNASELTYQSPYAPMIVLSDLIDETSATTQGSFRSDVGGLENMKNLIDPYALNAMKAWSEATSSYPNNKQRHLEIVQDAVRILHGQSPTATDRLQLQLTQNLANALKLMHTQIVNLMEETKMTKRANSLDLFPVRLRNFELLGPNERTTGYQAVKDALRQKQILMLQANGIDSVFSSLAMYTGGLIPLSKGMVSADDSTFISQIMDDMKNGRPTVTNSGRQALLNYLTRQAAANAVKNAVTAGTGIKNLFDYANTSTPVTIFKDIQDVLGPILYRVRDGNVSFKDAFDGMTNDDFNVLLADYERILVQSSNEVVKINWVGNVLGNEDIKKFFTVTQRQVPLLPESFETMEASDMLAIDFLSRCGVSAHLFPIDSFHLNSMDIFGNTATDPILLQLFDSGVDSLAKSLARGTGYDAVERKLVQRVSGIPGAFFNLTQIMDMMESEIADKQGKNVSNFYLLDDKGRRQQENIKLNLMKQSLYRLRLALNETRGTLTRNDMDMGSSWAWLNSAAKIAVLMRFGSNINLATMLVEGVTSAYATMSSSNNIFRNFLETVILMKDIGLQTLVLKGQDIYDSYVPQIDKNSKFKLKFFPLRQRKIRKMALNSMFTMDEVSSPLLPNNLHSASPTSELIESLSWKDRFVLARSRKNSIVMKAIRTAMDAQGNRMITRYLRNGLLQKFKAAYIARGRPFKSQDEINTFLRANKLTHIDLEIAIYIVRSGLLEGKRLEALDQIRRTYSSSYRGLIMFQDIFDEETKVLNGTSMVPAGFTSDSFREALSEGRASLSKFQEMNTVRGMVVRKALDAPKDDSIATNLLLFYKSYPTLYVAQQILRRSTLSPLHKMALQLTLAAALDFTYNVILSLARGTLSWEDIESKLARKDVNWAETLRYLLRHPITSNNPLGFVTQGALAAYTGKTQGGTLTSVGEAGINQWIKDIFGLGAILYKNESTWNEEAMQAYKAVGPLWGDANALPVRLAVNIAWGVSNTNSSGKRSGNRVLSTFLEQMDSVDDRLGNAIIRQLTPDYPKRLREEMGLNGIPTKFLDEHSRRIKKQTEQPKEPKIQPETKQPVVPSVQVPTEPKKVSFEDATKPLEVPEGLL